MRGRDNVRAACLCFMTISNSDLSERLRLIRAQSYFAPLDERDLSFLAERIIERHFDDWRHTSLEKQEDP